VGQTIVNTIYFMMMVCAINSKAETANKLLKIAVIDTGISLDRIQDASLCKTGHKDFTGYGLNDNHGHGTHIYGLIDQYAKNIKLKTNSDVALLSKTSVSYCQIIIKFYDLESTSRIV